MVERRAVAVDGDLEPGRGELRDQVGGRDEQEELRPAQEQREDEREREPDGALRPDRRERLEDRVEPARPVVDDPALQAVIEADQGVAAVTVTVCGAGASGSGFSVRT